MPSALRKFRYLKVFFSYRWVTELLLIDFIRWDTKEWRIIFWSEQSSGSCVRLKRASLVFLQSALNAVCANAEDYGTTAPPVLGWSDNNEEFRKRTAAFFSITLVFVTSGIWTPGRKASDTGPFSACRKTRNWTVTRTARYGPPSTRCTSSDRCSSPLITSASPVKRRPAAVWSSRSERCVALN